MLERVNRWSPEMFIAHTPNRWTRIRVWFSKHWDWSVLSTHAFGVLGLVFSVLGAANKVFPWHFSLVLVALIGFQSYYCSRYYRLKHERASPRKG